MTLTGAPQPPGPPTAQPACQALRLSNPPFPHTHAPETERVGADGGEEDGGRVGVDHGSAGGHRVGGGARGRGHQDPIRLDLIGVGGGGWHGLGRR